MASPKRVSSRHASDLLDAWVELREVASSGKKGSRHAEMEQAFANVEPTLEVDDRGENKRRGGRPRTKLFNKLAWKQSSSSSDVQDNVRDTDHAIGVAKGRRRLHSIAEAQRPQAPYVSKCTRELSLFLCNADKSEAEVMMGSSGEDMEPLYADGQQRFMSLLSVLPDKQLAPLKSQLHGIITGPDDTEMRDAYGDFASAWTVSTYPRHPSGRRQGDPVCDRYNIQLHSDMVLAAVADGCNWGTKPQEAAILASNEALTHVAAHCEEVQSVRCFGAMLLQAFMNSHQKIVGPKEDVWDAGTTTLIAGGMLQLAPDPALPSPQETRWCFVCASVGDCKAFLYRQDEGKFDEITKGNRTNLSDASDCGGRLGPYKNDGDPDLRNLQLYYCDLEEGDLVCICSDGVHDNLDPQMLGVDPRDVGLSLISWKDVGSDRKTSIEVRETKNTFMMDLLKRIGTIALKGDDDDGDEDIPIGRVLTPQSLSTGLIRHARAITSATRSYMEQNPKKKQPKDYTSFPGKMDHTTCVVFRVGKVEQHPFPSIEAVLSHPIGKEQFRTFLTEADTQSGKKMASSLDFIDGLYGLVRMEEERIPHAALELFERYIANGSHDDIEDELISRLVRVYFPRFQLSQWMRYECFFLSNGAENGVLGSSSGAKDEASSTAAE